jgi:hypothetical protein
VVQFLRPEEASQLFAQTLRFFTSSHALRNVWPW